MKNFKTMFRIREVKEMFVVEKQHLKWTLFGLKKEWKPYVTAAGLDEVWHHSTYDYAVMNLISEVKRDLITE